MPRKPNETDGQDSEALHGVITAMMQAIGRGGLTFIANRIGMTPSATQKRLAVPSRAFDEPTLRATVLVALSRADDLTEDFKRSNPIKDVTQVGELEIERRNVDGTITPYWRAK